MSDQSAAMDDTSLDVLAAQINRYFESLGHTGRDYDYHRILVGQLLIAARDRVEIGKWHDWLKAHINRSIRDCQKAMALTHALDPRKELADQREKNRQEVRRYRRRVRELAL